MGENTYFRVLSALFLILTSHLHRDAVDAYIHAAVASDVGGCSAMARNILQRGGSAVDAAITSVLCIGVVNPQSSGIGGGLSMVVYINSTKRAVALMAAEAAPMLATPDMFASRIASQIGIKTVAVPGEVLGLWEAHRLFGKLPWADLFAPVIEMAEMGFNVTSHLKFVINYLEDFPGDFPVLRNIYSRWKRKKADVLRAIPTNDTSDIMTSPLLAVTLRNIALYGPQTFYTGSVAHDMLQDIREAGGILTPADFATYNVLWKPVTATTFKNNLTMFSSPLTTSGPVLQYILNVLDGGILTPADFATYNVLWKPVTATTFKNNLTMFSSPLTTSGPVLQYILNVLDEYNITDDDFSSFDKKLRLYHRFLEIGKFAFALRSHLGDDPTSKTVRKILSALGSKKFAKLTASMINDTNVTHPNRHDYDISGGFVHAAKDYEGRGDTGHVSVMAPNGDAVSVTTSVGYYFGSKFYSRRTGVFLNNHLANFYFPNRESSPIWRWPTANGIAPKRRYLTTVCPSMLVDDEGNVKMVVGASGGSKIVLTNAWVILRTLWMGSSLKHAVDEKRIYNYLPNSNSAYYEEGFSEELLDQLAIMGHLNRIASSFAVSQVILKNQNGTIDAYSDPRKGGLADGF